jgi:hypothetical protein
MDLCVFVLIKVLGEDEELVMNVSEDEDLDLQLDDEDGEDSPSPEKPKRKRLLKKVTSKKEVTVSKPVDKKVRKLKKAKDVSD